MFRPALTLAAVSLASALGLAACADDADPAPAGQTDDVTSQPQLKANMPGMTVWVDQLLHADHKYGADVWVVHGRVSKNLERAMAFVADDEYGDTQVPTPRTFDLTFDGNMLPNLIEGTRLFVSLNPEDESPSYVATMTIAPKLRAATGSTSITIGSDLTPVLVADRVEFRGLATLAHGVGAFGAADAAGPALLITHPSAYHYGFDFDARSLADVVHGSPLVKLTGKRASTPIETDAQIQFEVTSLDITQKDPYTTFPDPPCDPKVEACLAALHGTDTGGCGSAKQVGACRNQIPWPNRFALDFQVALGDWYAIHAADVAAAGGNDKNTAEGLVDVAKVTEVTDPEADPEGHDLTKFRVFSHPDVVFPGSDTRWFGAYSRDTNLLEHVYDFN